MYIKNSGLRERKGGKREKGGGQERERNKGDK